MNADAESTPEPMDALRQSCGLIDAARLAGFVVSGADRERFLNGYLTCEVAGLTEGQGVYGFFTSAQGRILADAFVTAKEDALLVEVPRDRVEPLVEHLSRYILADQVELAAEQPMARWLLVGPRAEAVAATLGEVPQETWATTRVELPEGTMDLSRRPPLGVPVFSLRAVIERAPHVLECFAEAGATAVSPESFEVLRIEAGAPRYGADFDEAHFPQETGIEEAVSYTKGCYLGQEVVARIHYRGHVNHQLRGLRFAAGAAPTTGSVTLDANDVGRLGSVEESPVLGAPVGLAILHRKAAEEGVEVTAASGDVARVELPGFALQALGTDD